MKAESTHGLWRRAASSAPGIYAAYVAHGVLHPDLLRATSAREAEADLPGDAIVTDPDWVTTFSTDIRAPREDVWPWLVQMGYGRAGWYTWYRHDNGGVRSPSHIVPELQTLQVGDSIPDGPRANEGFGVWRVETLEPPRALVLVSRRNPFTGREIAADDGSKEVFVDCSWAFVVEETSPETSTLFIRVRAKLERVRKKSVFARAARLLFGVGDTVMERTLLEGVKRRAEARYEARRGSDGGA